MRNGRVEMLSGVTPGDRVVERGAGFLKDGDSIRVVEADEGNATSVVRAPAAGGST